MFLNFIKNIFLVNNSNVIDKSFPITSDNLFWVYIVLAVLAVLCIGVIIYLWNRSGKKRDKD